MSEQNEAKIVDALREIHKQMVLTNFHLKQIADALKNRLPVPVPGDRSGS